MISTDKATEIFYLIDDFCKEMGKVLDESALETDLGKGRCKRKSTMTDSEVITIMMLFHQMGYRCLKHFYLNHVVAHMQDDFPQTVSYNRFVELQKKCTLPMVVFFCRPTAWAGARVFPF